MAQVNLRADTGRKTGSRASRRLRRSGAVPAIVYGRGSQPINVAVNHHDLMVALHTEAGLNVLINLEIAGQAPVLTLPRGVESHPYRNELRHVDFIRVSLKEKVRADVVVHAVGDAPAVKEGGILSVVKSTVEVEALPTDIPGTINVDVSSLALGDDVRVSDLPVIEGVAYLDDERDVVVAMTVPHVEAEPEPEEGEEAAEGAGAEPTEAEASE